MEFYCVKIAGDLCPTEEESAEKMASLGSDTLITCKTNGNRNYKNHKRFFAFVKIAFEMQSHFTDIGIFRKWLTMGAGYFKSAVTPKGVTIFIPESIAFGGMDEDEFKVLFKKSLDYYLEQLSGSRQITDDEFIKLLDFI